MNKLIILFVLATTLLSCSSDDSNTNPDLVLQKVVFYDNSPNEKHWIINNNLLTTITLADGTVVEEFIYDAQNRVIKDTKYTNGVISETNIITYTYGWIRFKSKLYFIYYCILFFFFTIYFINTIIISY